VTECKTRRRLQEANPLSDALEHAGVVRLIGNTPLVRLTRFAARHGVARQHAIYLKAEWTNPGGSVKDRPALGIVRAAIERGELGDGKTLLDSTSGNTGIAYAMLGAALGFPVELVVPESASEERKRILAAYGATVTFSDPYDGSNGAIRLVREMAATNPDRWFYADQYGNPANPAAHFATTGPEIWHQTVGAVTHFVAGLGTTGTMMGTGAFLKTKNPDMTLAAVQPSEAFHGIEGLKHLPTAIVPDIYDAGLPDRQIAVDTDEAYDLTRDLAATEGLFAGASTGAALGGALKIARELGEFGNPAVIVALAPDGGGKYLSTGLWT
jgi:cysteine synthase B